MAWPQDRGFGGGPRVVVVGEVGTAIDCERVENRGVGMLVKEFEKDCHRGVYCATGE